MTDLGFSQEGAEYPPCFSISHLSLFPLYFPHFFLFFFLFLFSFLRSKTPWIQLGGWGSAMSTQRGLGRSHSQSQIWCILALSLRYNRLTMKSFVSLTPCRVTIKWVVAVADPETGNRGGSGRVGGGVWGVGITPSTENFLNLWWNK